MKELEIRKIRIYECPECYARYDSEIEAFRCCTELSAAEAHIVTTQDGDRLSASRWYELSDAIGEYLYYLKERNGSLDKSVTINLNFKDEGQ